MALSKTLLALLDVLIDESTVTSPEEDKSEPLPAEVKGGERLEISQEVVSSSHGVAEANISVLATELV